MLIKVELKDKCINVEDAIQFAQNKKELCLLSASKQLKGRCFEDGWVSSVLEVNNISEIYPDMFHGKINSVTFDAIVEIDHVNDGSIVLATVESLDGKFIHLYNDRTTMALPVTYTQDGLQAEIDMNIFKPGQIIPIAIGKRAMAYAARQITVTAGQLHIPLPVSIRFIPKGKINYEEFVPYVKVAEKLQEQIKKIDNPFLEKILYPYKTDQTGGLDKMSMVSIINIANGSDDVDDYRYVKDSRINWGVVPYLMKERFDKKTKQHEDVHPPGLISTRNVPSQKFIKILLLNYIYYAELFLAMNNTYTAEVSAKHENLWKLMNSLKRDK